MHDTLPTDFPGPRAHAHATIAFDQFIAARLALAAEPLIDDLPRWEDALRQRLDSDELINVEARVRFEYMVAQLLAQGWQRGHHTLLAAATRVFQWDDDKRRLHQFGLPGAHVDQAIEERFQFETQALKDYTIERDVLDRLRLLQVPADYYLQRYIPSVERMLARYPAFIAITVSPAPIAQWQARSRALPRAFDRDDSAGPDRSRGAGKRWGRNVGNLVVTVIVLIYVLCLVYNASEPDPALDHTPATARHSKGKHAAAKPGEPSPTAQLNAQQRREIEARIHYQPKKLPSAPLKVVFTVYVSASGELAFLGRDLASDDPAFDDAVAAAIHETRRFDVAAIPYKFPFTYSWTPGQRPAQ